ncbi:Targeting protein for Xklp2 [Fukomys damarensis]|uniref:Targeting protein for Xklp2 n=1 Tax=Fukomys damarensis TaxID=885580 RepID=A0A091DN42_FUKDA|nr:Targeting protein for Xklp2 [Fukomys damarensis]
MKISQNRKEPEEEEEEEGSAQDTSKNNKNLPPKVKGRHTMPHVATIKQKVLKSTEEQELEKSMKMQQEPIGFDLEIEKRIQEEDSKKSEDERFEFHCRPCPTKILEDVVSVPEKKVLPVTIPKSPAFALRNRIALPTKEDEEEDEPAVIRAQPMPPYGVPFKHHIPEARTVEISPFSFDSWD